MKRYFDITGERLTLELEVTKEGMKHTVEDLRKMLKIPNLKEITRKEYNRLGKEYTS